MYHLNYLPIATQDMSEILDYISHELFNPHAAEKLATEMVEYANKLTIFPYSNAVYYTDTTLKQEYRKLNVKNYIMFYWINESEKQITITRILYARRDYKKLL